MLEVVSVIYSEGKLVPETPLNYPEGAKLKIIVESEPKSQTNWHVQEPTITDPEERKKLFEEMFKRWDENPIPADAPRKFTREEMHERR